MDQFLDLTNRLRQGLQTARSNINDLTNNARENLSDLTKNGQINFTNNISVNMMMTQSDINGDGKISKYEIKNLQNSFRRTSQTLYDYGGGDEEFEKLFIESDKNDDGLDK